MSTDQSPKYTLYRHPGNAFTFDYPSHWQSELEDDKITARVFPGNRKDVQIQFEVFPFSIDTKLFGDRFSNSPVGWIT